MYIIIFIPFLVLVFLYSSYYFLHFHTLRAGGRRWWPCRQSFGACRSLVFLSLPLPLPPCAWYLFYLYLFLSPLLLISRMEQHACVTEARDGGEEWIGGSSRNAFPPSSGFTHIPSQSNRN
ncbi:hypothetical protein B0H66DRAFT_545465 [Apodospora peruviana]|uniref:Uncharacterized protein n=1 Tax=Apodospora peruviana TaxID=516989 RepID=A0AAE0MFV4_9PEZI|nr:hypothetical protein B0H66DRAFT_545465 [Apodospora peruviana]